MRSARKYACYVVQAALTAALLLQQCPLRAIAQGLNGSGSGGVEADAAPAASDGVQQGSGEDADAADGATGEDNSVTADAAAGTADGGGGSEDAPRAADGQPEPAGQPDEELAWTRIGTCEWSKDSAATLS